MKVLPLPPPARLREALWRSKEGDRLRSVIRESKCNPDAPTSPGIIKTFREIASSSRPKCLDSSQ